MAIWKAQRTLLLVGEGRHEEAFLNHVKQLYAPRGCGLSVTIKNARGKGAKHVVDWTIRQAAIAKYDAVAAMLDTDTDWTPAVPKLAKSRKIQVLASDPCFEAVLLRLLGRASAMSVGVCKQQLAPYVNHDPTQRQNYVQHFGSACLEAGREHEPTIDALLRLMEK